MSVDSATYNALLDMGIEPPVARKAATMYTKVDAAVEWCFGPGLEWKAEQDAAPPKRPVPPTPDFAKPGTTVEHREVATNHGSAGNYVDWNSLTEAARPRVPPRANDESEAQAPRATSPRPFGDKNPFLNAAPKLQPQLNPTNPFNIHEKPSESYRFEDDEELQQAIAMSMGQDEKMDLDSNDEDERMQRDRSLRATAPPPSPSPDEIKDHDMGAGINAAFGPSQRSDPDGSMALVPRSAPLDDVPTRSKEDEDMEKAIADSLMTASFHSAASAPHEAILPPKAIRAVDAPVVLYSQSGQHTATANMLQAVLQLPGIHEYIRRLIREAEVGEVTTEMFHLLLEQDNLDEGYRTVDDLCRKLKGINGRRDELPPIASARQVWTALLDLWGIEQAGVAATVLSDWQGDEKPDLAQLVESRVVTRRQVVTNVTIWRSQIVNDVYAGLANALWETGDEPASIEETSDILVTFIGWNPDAKRQLFKLDQKLVLDRFMTKNQGWAMNMRAQGSMAAGNVRRTQEAIDKLTKHDGHDIATSLQATIKHYGIYSGKDEMQKESRSEMKAKLESILATLTEKVAKLRSQLLENEKIAVGGVFDTDDPARNEHVYGLRAVLFHDGGLVGPRHLYMYLLCEDGAGEDQWFKIQEHESTRVDWSDVVSDATGIYMEGGPYCVIYDRESNRKEPYAHWVDPDPGLTVKLGQHTVMADKIFAENEIYRAQASSGVPHIPEPAAQDDVHIETAAPAAAPAPSSVAAASNLSNDGDGTTSTAAGPLVDVATQSAPARAPRPLPQVPDQAPPPPDTSKTEQEKKEPEDHIMS